jgi:hypothetical protein
MLCNLLDTPLGIHTNWLRGGRALDRLQFVRVDVPNDVAVWATRFQSPPLARSAEATGQDQIADISCFPATSGRARRPT